MGEYLETCSDKSILSNILCILESIVLKNNYLKNNYFENGELNYHQKRGFVIGTKFASPYSNFFMTRLEKSISQNSELEPFLRLWYLDEIFSIWAQVPQKLNELSKCINSLHLKIIFATGYSITEINFLGATVTKVGHKLEANLYSKRTNTHPHLHAHSHHCNAYKGSIAYRQVV